MTTGTIFYLYLVCCNCLASPWPPIYVLYGTHFGPQLRYTLNNLLTIRYFFLIQFFFMETTWNFDFKGWSVGLSFYFFMPICIKNMEKWEKENAVVSLPVNFKIKFAKINFAHQFHFNMWLDFELILIFHPSTRCRAASLVSTFIKKSQNDTWKCKKYFQIRSIISYPRLYDKRSDKPTSKPLLVLIFCLCITSLQADTDHLKSPINIFP